MQAPRPHSYPLTSQNRGSRKMSSYQAIFLPLFSMPAFLYPAGKWVSRFPQGLRRLKHGPPSAKALYSDPQTQDHRGQHFVLKPT